MAPGQPLLLLWSGVNRVTNNGNVRGLDQRVSRLGALKAVTLDAAYSLQMDKDLGSIAPGKLANFTILADNPVTIDPMKIKDIKVLGTVQEGRVLPVRRNSEALATAGAVNSDARADGDFPHILTARLVELLSHQHGDEPKHTH